MAQGKETLTADRYRKVGRTGARMVEGNAYVLKVKKEKKFWRERGQRERVWFEKEEAASKLKEPGLKALIPQAMREALSDRFADIAPYPRRAISGLVPDSFYADADARYGSGTGPASNLTA